MDASQEQPVSLKDLHWQKLKIPQIGEHFGSYGGILSI